MKSKKYDNSKAFRTALEDRLNRISKLEKIDILRLRRQVAFDRLLARFFSRPSTPWVLKGGYAMQLRIDSARATKDVDLAMKEVKLLSANESDRITALLELLRNESQKDLGDFFNFIIGSSIMDLEAAPYGGSRFLVESQVDGRNFEKFHLDVGIGDVWMEPLELLPSNDYLSFAGIKSQKFPAIPKEQQFAEKLHAYTLPRPEGRPNSRVKDLIDMNLLIQDGMNLKLLNTALNETYKRRRTHDLNLAAQTPPTSWGATFSSLAIDCDLNPDINNGFKLLTDFLKKL
jgi:hypothetical protein